MSRKEAQARVADTLDRFHIVGKKDLYPAQLSGGQQQLVGVARAGIGEPKLLLADEPTGNLHSGQAREIMELFLCLNREGTTIVQVTHSTENASYGRRTLRMADGWLRGDEPGRPGGAGSSGRVDASTANVRSAGSLLSLFAALALALAAAGIYGVLDAAG